MSLRFDPGLPPFPVASIHDVINGIGILATEFSGHALPVFQRSSGT
jgi:hypothetical protein